ncbi:MAG: hypothetical protein OIF32_00685 [Campylobacterales bacterium]|nr:hypothetical protein [Campylobacterales bacterium]
MIISNFSTPTVSAFKKPDTEETSQTIANRILKEEEVANDITEVKREETLSVVAENGEILQKSNKILETGSSSYSTSNMKKQLDEQSYLRTDSVDRQIIRTNMARHDFLGMNLSVVA